MKNKFSILLSSLISLGLLAGCGEPGPKGDTGSQGPKGDTGSQGQQGLPGANGKSAYELYLEAHPGYTKSEKEWLDEFFKNDETDYTSYNNFEFVPLTYGGVKGYSASYIGTGGKVVVPETFNLEPVLGFKFGFNDMHELESDSSFSITSIYCPSNIKFFAINGNSSYVQNCLDATQFIFTASLDEVISGDFEFERIYFDGTSEELLETNLALKFPISNIYTIENESSTLVINNYEKFRDKYLLAKNKVEVLKLTNIPDLLSKFDDNEISMPSAVTIDYNDSTIDIPVKVEVTNPNEVCSVSDNTLTYKASKLNNYEGKEEFTVNFNFELEGRSFVGSTSTFIVSKVPNKFKAFNRFFSLDEYNEVESTRLGNKYSLMNQVRFIQGKNEIKAYIDNEYGEYETAMPTIEEDNDFGHSENIFYDSTYKCLDCSDAGEYRFGLAYLASKNKFVYRLRKLDSFDRVCEQKLCETMQQRYVCNNNDVYVNEDDTVTFDNNVGFTFDNTSYFGTLSISTTSTLLAVSGNQVTFDLDGADSGFGSVSVLIDFGGGNRYNGIYRFHISK